MKEKEYIISVAPFYSDYHTVDLQLIKVPETYVLDGFVIASSLMSWGYSKNGFSRRLVIEHIKVTFKQSGDTPITNILFIFSPVREENFRLEIEWNREQVYSDEKNFGKTTEEAIKGIKKVFSDFFIKQGKYKNYCGQNLINLGNSIG